MEDDDDTEASLTGSIDPDIVLTNGSDADSSGDSKIMAHSVDGEEELVDVTMKDARSAAKESQYQ